METERDHKGRCVKCSGTGRTGAERQGFCQCELGLELLKVMTRAAQQEQTRVAEFRKKLGRLGE